MGTVSYRQTCSYINKQRQETKNKIIKTLKASKATEITQGFNYIRNKCLIALEQVLSSECQMTPVDFCFPKFNVQEQWKMSSLEAQQTFLMRGNKSGREFYPQSFDWILTHTKILGREKRKMFLLQTLDKRQIMKIKSRGEKEMCDKVLQHHPQFIGLW